jgi:anti-sigma regulatory factor (Ser/Thr protein kinase)
MTTATGDLIIPLMGSAAAVGLARTLAGARFHKWGCSHVLDDALLIVSELVTNAVDRMPGAELRLQVSRDAHGVIVAVWDGASDLPAARPKVELALDDLDLSEEAFDANGGWGLHIVEALSAACGAMRDPCGGKWVWARIIP